MPEQAIIVEGLVKMFGTTRALDGLDLVVERGEVHGFLGPNGAGKSTTLRALLGLIGVDSGNGWRVWSGPLVPRRLLAAIGDGCHLQRG